MCPALHCTVHAPTIYIMELPCLQCYTVLCMNHLQSKSTVCSYYHGILVLYVHQYNTAVLLLSLTTVDTKQRYTTFMGATKNKQSQKLKCIFKLKKLLLILRNESHLEAKEITRSRVQYVMRVS